MATDTAAVHLTWATGWMLSRINVSGSDTFQISVWRAEAGTGTPVLSASNDRLAWVYFGAQPPPQLQDVASSTDWVERFLENSRIADDLSGVFALLALDRRTGRIAVAGDRLGVQPVYYVLDRGGVSHISTHLMWLLVATEHDGSVDDESFFSHFSFGYAISDTHTAYRNVLRLPPAAHLVSDCGRCTVEKYWERSDVSTAPQIPELVAALQQSMRPTAGNSPVFLPLTAGKDSLCLASIVHEDLQMSAGTFGAPQCADRIQGEQIAADLDVRYRAGGLCSAASLQRWMAYVALHSGGLATASYVDMARFVGTIVPPRATVVLGEGGECVREFFRTGEGPVDALSRSYMTPVELLRGSLAERFADGLDSYPGSLLDSARRHSRQHDDEAFAVEFYRSVRMPGNFSLRHAVLSTLRPKVSPFLDSTFIKSTYGLPTRWFRNSALHRTIVETVRPAWLRFFDHPVTGGATTQNWEARMRGAVGRQLASTLANDLHWCDDVFDAAGVRDLMARTAARPDRAMHHLLRVGSFAAGRRLLRTGGAELAQHISERTVIVASQSASGLSSQLPVGELAPATVA
jgi:hypothetical protein